LRVVACRTANNAIGEFFPTKARDLIVRAAQLERKYRLQVLSFHQDPIVDTHRENLREFERRLDCNVINVGVADQVQVVNGVHLAVIAHRAVTHNGNQSWTLP